MSNGLNNSDPATCPPPKTGCRWALQLLAILSLAGLFLAFSLVRSPIPGINESHYLCKARHFWQPDWCRGDLFLESANPHAVFYAVFGGLTTRLSFDQAALLIRIGQSLLLAAGWMSLAVRCLGDQKRAMTAALLFLLLQATGTWSGEWMVGGAESKVWAYGALMLGAAWTFDQRLCPAALMAGLAVSFHPVVGAWGVIIAVLAFVLKQVSSRWFKSEQIVSWTCGVDSKSMTLGLVIFVVTSLPGIIPAIQSLRAPSSEAASEADFLQVAERLPHHLDPLTFPVRAWRDYGLLLIVWLLVRGRIQGRSRAIQWMEWALWGSMIVAAAGIAAAWGPRPIKEMAFWQLRVKVMKLYPFRLADMLIPITLALTVSAAIWQRVETFRSVRARQVFFALGSIVILAVAFRVPGLDRGLSQQPKAVQADWSEACRWIREHTPANASLYATNDNWSLRWSAERPEYFHFKDCPQDAAGILEWHRRYWLIYNWKLQVFADGRVTARELTDLRKSTGITHLVCGRFGPLDVPAVFNSPNVKVYELPNR